MKLKPIKHRMKVHHGLDQWRNTCWTRLGKRQGLGGQSLTLVCKHESSSCKIQLEFFSQEIT